MPIQAYKLAKELGITVKDLVERAAPLGITVKGNFTILGDEEAEKARVALAVAPAAAEEAPSLPEPAEETPPAIEPPPAPAREEARAPAEDAAAKPPAAKVAGGGKASGRKAAAAGRAPVTKGEAGGPAPAGGKGSKAGRTEGAADAALPAVEPPPAKASKPAMLPFPLAVPTVSPAEKASDEPIPTKASLLHLKEDAPEVRVLRPAEVDKLSSDLPTDPAKEKRKTKPLPRPAGNGGVDAASRTRERPKFRREVRPLDMAGEAARRAAIMDRTIEIQLPVTPKGLSQQLGLKTALLMRNLVDSGVLATLNTPLAEETVSKLAQDFKRNILIKKERDVEQEVLGAEPPDRPEDRTPRAPVVTFLGHVDHGKTSLLDRIRKTNVAAQESGGITQHIGAWKITTASGAVAFLDTPGHEAFTAMRARGAHVTDVAVLVVAADDGVMPQTEEAINHARAANVPIVVAINKVDKKEANVHRVKSQLSPHGLIAEDWGGNTVMVEVSAVTGQGVEKLVEMLSLEAELLELRANPMRPARGVILEAKKHDARGVLATALVQDGTLRAGDVVVCGTVGGRVRALYDHLGRPVDEAGPSTPVELLGLTELPAIGEPFRAVPDLATAKAIAEDRLRRGRPAAAGREHVTLETLFSQIESGKVKEARIVFKADVKGSAEVLRDAFTNLSTAEVRLRVLHTGIGSINESDALLADASNAIIIGFNVAVEERARVVAKEKRVDVRLYQVIYHAVEEMKAALEGLLEPEEVEVVTGHFTVKQIFKASRIGNIAGGLVTDGKVERTSHVRLVRDKQVLYTGKIESLRRFKDDVKEVLESFECGLRLAGHDDIREGDVVEAYQIQYVAKKLK